MSVASAVDYFRRRQADLFSDTGTLTRASGEPTFDPNTGTYTTPTPTTVYSGACLIRPESRDAMTEVQAGETEVTLNRFLVKFPVDTDARVDDSFTPDTSTYDAGLVGREMVVIDVQLDGLQVCRRVVMEAR